jgi:hypothetical protein
MKRIAAPVKKSLSQKIFSAILGFLMPHSVKVEDRGTTDEDVLPSYEEAARKL